MYTYTYIHTTQILRDVGKSLGVAALDLEGANPWSRVPNSNQRTLEEQREWIKGRLMTNETYRYTSIYVCMYVYAVRELWKNSESGLKAGS